MKGKIKMAEIDKEIHKVIGSIGYLRALTELIDFILFNENINKIDLLRFIQEKIKI